MPIFEVVEILEQDIDLGNILKDSHTKHEQEEPAKI